MPRRPGRPRANLERKILADMSNHETRLEAILPKPLGSTAWRMAYEAACLRLTLEKGSNFETARCAPLIDRLRNTKWALANDPRRTLPDDEFLERLIEAQSPGFDWRQDAREGEIEDENRRREDERIAKEIAESERVLLARFSKFVTPDAPDASLLLSLAWEWRHKPLSREEMKQPGWSPKPPKKMIRRTCPTLRELKLATAIPERTLKKIVKSLRPKKGEIIKEPLQHKFSRRGAVPLRYGPRLVIGVLNEFLKRLPEFSITDEERQSFRKMAIRVKRAFAARLNPSRRST